MAVKCVCLQCIIGSIVKWKTDVYVHAFVMKFKSEKENEDVILHH